MADSYLGEIRLFSFNTNRIPRDFVPCDGRSLQIRAYEALYAVIGTIYGGDGVTTFKVPNMQGRVPVHVGKMTGDTHNYTIGQTAGSLDVTLTVANMPAHTHTVSVSSNPASAFIPSRSLVQGAAADGALIYCDAAQTGTTQVFASGTIKPSNNSISGGSPHNNVQPTISLTYAICINGLFPYQG